MTLGVLEQQYWQTIELEAKPKDSVGIKAATPVTIERLMRDMGGPWPRPNYW